MTKLASSDSNVLRMTKGLLLSFLVTILCLLLFSTVLTYSSVGENTIVPVSIIVTAISILIGTSFSMAKAKKNGMLYGGMVGFVYMLLLYLISSSFTGDFTITVTSGIMIGGAILAGAVGGIIGVNRK